MKSPKILINTLMFLILSTAAWAANPGPAIFYSDLTAGPNTGGQNNLGVFVTIWGTNFGSTQGSSYITVGGGKVNNYQTWTNTMICFQLGSLAATGNIVLVTSNGNATGPAFTVQAGNIYFVQPGAATNGTGTYTSPFNHLYYAYQIVAPGDTTYVEAGTIFDQIEGYPGWHTLFMPTTTGTQSEPISWIAYPNATVTLKADGGIATWTDGSSGGTDSVSYIFRGNGPDWQTFSKFYLVFTGGVSAGLADVADSNGQNGWKFVGNNSTASFYIYCQFCIGGANGSVLGNTIHDSGSSISNGNEAHSIYVEAGADPFEVGWNNMINNENTGWEISNYHNGPRIGTIHDNLIIAASPGSVKGILVDGCGDTPSPDTLSTMETNVVKAYNNIIVNAGQYEYGGAMQANCGTNYIYNNTIYGSGTEVDGVIQFETGGIGPGGGNPVEYVANNIIYANNSGLYLSDSQGNAPTWSEFKLITNNNYYGEGNGPTQDAAAVNANPQFVSPSTSIGGNFQLQSTSPDINAGYNTTSIVAADFNGLLRGSIPSIGAYEYTSATSTATPSPVVAITSPSSGISLTTGSNVSITATASETNGTITNIAIYNGSTLLGASSSSPYTYTMTNPAIGTYTLTAVATDANGISTTSSAVVVTVATQSITPSSPVVTITSPATGSNYTAGSNVTITTTASETNGTISNISLYNGSGILLGSSSTSPYNYVDSSVAAGTYTFYAVAKDANGVSTTSSSTTVTITAAASASPVAAITSPANGTSYADGSTMITITASASETNGSIAKLSIYYNGTNLMGTSTTSPFSVKTSASPAGAYVLTAVATDANGVSVTSSPVTITITAPSVPVVSLTSNTTSFTAPANIILTATASETNGTISKVAFYNGSSLLGTATSSPFSFTWSNVAAGSYSLTAVATDANGVSTTSSPISITITALSLPVVSLISPANKSSYTAGSNISITATASETNGTIAQVQFYDGTTLLGSSSTSPYSYTWSNVEAGSYSLTAVATDANGDSTTSSPIAVTITSVTSSSMINITSPDNGSAFTAGSNITVTTSSSLSSGSITTAEFFNGSTLLGTVLRSPYSYTWSNVPAGIYNLTAKIITKKNGTQTSSPVSVTVTSLPTVSLAVNNTSFTAPASIDLSAAASETSGTISQVQFYNGSTLLGTDTTSPYSYTWTNVPAGSYSLTAKATDANGVSTTSSASTVTVSSPISSVAPSITTQPVSATVTAPATATFTVAATGTPAPTFQWMQSVNGGTFNSISGANSASYTTAATTTANSGTKYECVVTNASGSVTSSAAILTVNPMPVTPSITAQPVSMTVTAPAMATFAVAATGTPAPSFQWMQSVNGGAFTNISGATSASYTTAATSTSNSGTEYVCVVSNASGSVTSNAASLTVNPDPVAPSFTTQPVSVTVTAPATAMFTVAATGTPAPSFQWMQSVNGGAFTNISGATSASYTTAATTTANSGTEFECKITNASGSVTSNAASLTVNPTPVAPSFTAQPVSVTVTAPATATFTVAATGTPAPSFQWMQSVNGGAFTNISGATSASFKTAVTTTANSGTQFECKVSNASGSVTSNPASLTVNPDPGTPPSIITQPVNVKVLNMETAIFTVVAIGSPAPGYQWFSSPKGGSFTAISGATSPYYITLPASPSNNGTQYQCVITNAAGSATSNSVTLTVG